MSRTGVICEIGNERIHGLKPGRIDHRAAVAPNRYESCLAQSVQVECERVGRQSKATGDMACRHSLRPGLDQQAEYVEAVVLRQGGEDRDSVLLSHNSISIEMMEGSQYPFQYLLKYFDLAQGILKSRGLRPNTTRLGR